MDFCAAKSASALPWQPPVMTKHYGSGGRDHSCAMQDSSGAFFALELFFEGGVETFSDLQVR